MIKNKKALVKIIEAFVAVMIVLSVSLIVISRQRVETNRDEELGRLLRYTLDYLSKDESLRSQILANDTSGVNDRIGKIVPSWANYSSNICPAQQICPNPAGIIKKTVYSNSVFITSNLTYFSKNNETLWVFLWEK